VKDVSAVVVLTKDPFVVLFMNTVKYLGQNWRDRQDETVSKPGIQVGDYAGFVGAVREPP
jgi:hypothetical protein